MHDSRIDDGNTALTFKRIKSPDRFTGGQAVHWMITFTVTLFEDHPFFDKSVLIRNYRRIFTNGAVPIHQTL